MKKKYIKPMVMKRENLTAATAQKVVVSDCTGVCGGGGSGF